jgi:cytochrome o ubiquinol oxidase subunit 3
MTHVKLPPSEGSLFQLSDKEHPEHHDASGTKVFGFWLYLMTDCILFASLFATYAVLQVGVADGPRAKDIFDLSFVLVETFLLLFSSVTFGFAMIAAYSKNVNRTMLWLVVTMLFGLGFLGMELYEFNHLIHIGAGPGESAFLSAFFALVGTHGLHVTFGVIWLVTLLVLLRKHGLTETSMTRLKCLSLFWHFLDIIWICVFSLVYLAGAA